MELGTLIERSTQGDWQAFADLIALHQSLAFGYAFAMLGDFHLAEDATQEAFAAVYFQLHTLRSPDAFAWWLRGIVRHQCSRVLRKPRHPVVALEQAAGLSAEDPSVDEQVIARDAGAEVVAAINALPLAEREVLALFYVKDLSRRQIAAFLGIPITTVNNRLHSARSKLKRSMVTMAQDTFQSHALPDDFAARVGRLLEIRGPVIDMEFPADQRPPLLAVLSIAGEGGATLEATVAQHLDDGRVRGVVAASQALAPGMRVQPTGTWAEQPLDEVTLRQVLEQIGQPAEAPRPEIVETGIKSIDLLAPFAKGGRVAILGPMGVGKTVLIQEVIHNLRGRDRDISLFTFVKPGAEVALFREVVQEAARLSLSLAQMITLTTADPRELGAAVEEFDAVISMSIYRAVNQFWPAVDVLRSSSRALTPEVAGAEHMTVATGVRGLLGQLTALEQRIRGENVYQLTAEERQVIGRGRRLERFFTQPFHVAEEYTKRPGSHVSLADTIRGCAAILAGECDDLPETAFLFGGTIDEIRARAGRSS